jgi:copper transport protein
MFWTKQGRKREGTSWAGVPLLLALLALWLLVFGPSRARAHALLVRSIPEANAELTQPPATLEMWFSEPLEAGFSGARLVNSLGQEVPTGAVNLDPSDSTHMTLPLGQLEPGIYTVAWQTLSQVDGHEWFGSFPFTVLNADGSRPTGSAALVGEGERGELPTPGEALARWFALLGGLLFFGAPLFQRFIVPRSREPNLSKMPSGVKNNTSLETYTRDLVLRTIWIAVLLITLGGWLQIMFQTGRLGGLSRLPDLLLGTRTGTLVLTRQILALAGLFLALGLPQPWPIRGRERLFFLLSAVGGAITLLMLLIAAIQGERVLVIAMIVLAVYGLALVGWVFRQETDVVERRTWLALLGLAAALLLNFSAGSHAGAVPGSVWAVLGDYIHLVAAAVWIGGLVLLPVLIWQIRRTTTATNHSQLLPLVRRFSYFASFAVFILVVSGLFNSLVELSSLSSLLDTSYGRVLLVKLFLIMFALEVAFFNNRLVHRQARQLRHTSGLHRFNRQVALEAIFGLGVMLSVAVLVQTPAPRSLASTTGAFQLDLPFNTIARADDLYVHVQVTPNQVGNNRFWVHLYHPDTSSIGEVQLVRLFFNYQEEQLGQATVDLEPQGQDTFAVEGAYTNQAGMWDLSVYIRRRGMDDALAEVSLEVPAPTGEIASTNPWQNPIPALPSGLVIAGGLIALGLVPLIWRRPLRAAQTQGFLTVSLIGGILILSGLVMAVGSSSALLTRTNPADKPILSSPGSIAQGAELFQERCTSCHGIKGLGDGPLAATLEPPPANLGIHVPLHNDRELYGFVSQGFPNTAMPAFEESLSSDQIWHLINYLRDEFGQRR